ncbi:MAG: hypothetical protein SGILL_004212 [Bacillariaceae sp.]
MMNSLLNYARSNSILGRSSGATDTCNEDDNNNTAAPATNTITIKRKSAAARSPSPGSLDITMPFVPPPSAALVAAAATAQSNTKSNAKKNSDSSSTMKPNRKKRGPYKKKAPAKHDKPRKPRRAIPENKEYIPESEQPSDADVVGGRGGRSNHHAGNRPYWIKILGSRVHYRSCVSDASKTMIAQDILNFIKVEKGGRFLNLDSNTNRWFMLPDAVVLDKIKQALRDKYIPFWAKNMDIPTVEPGSLSSATKTVSEIIASSSRKPQSRPSLKKKVAASEHAVRNDETNRLGFLLSASRAAPQLAPTATLDDILKFKYDNLPSLANGGGGAPSNAAAAGAPAFPFGVAAAMGAPSLGMGMFHSVQQDPGLLASMASMGGGSAFVNHALAAGGGPGINHGFGAGGNTGAPSLGGGFPVAPAGLMSSFDMKSGDFDRILGASNLASNKSIDLLKSLTASGITSIGSIGGISSLGMMPDGLGAAAAADDNGRSSSKSPASGGGSSSNKKTDWNAMFSSALSSDKKEAV